MPTKIIDLTGRFSNANAGRAANPSVQDSIGKYADSHGFKPGFSLEEITSKYDSHEFKHALDDYFSGCRNEQDIYLMTSVLNRVSEGTELNETMTYMRIVMENLTNINAIKSFSVGNDRTVEYLSSLAGIYEEPETGELSNPNVDDESKQEILKSALKKTKKMGYDPLKVATFIEDRLIAETNCSTNPDFLVDREDGLIELNQDFFGDELKEAAEKLRQYQVKLGKNEAEEQYLDDLVVGYGLKLQRTDVKNKMKDKYRSDFVENSADIMMSLKNGEEIYGALRLINNMLIYSSDDETGLNMVNDSLETLRDNFSDNRLKGEQDFKEKDFDSCKLLGELLDSDTLKANNIEVPKGQRPKNINYTSKYLSLLNNVFEAKENERMFSKDKFLIVSRAIERSKGLSMHYDNIESYVNERLSADRAINA